MKGRRIKSLNALMKAASEKRAVISDNYCFRGPIAAAFIASMQGTTILRLMTSGMWIYKPKRNTGPFRAVRKKDFTL